GHKKALVRTRAFLLPAALGRHGMGNTRLALAELLAATCLVEADLLTFDFTGVTRNQTGLRQLGLERGVVVDQGAGDAVAHCAGLARFTAATYVDLEVVRFEMVGERQGLANNHAAGFASEVFVNGLAVHDDIARPFFQEYARYRGFAAASSVVPVADHARLLVGMAESSSSGFGCCAECGCSVP